jgi:xanthine/uracil permease
MGRTMISAIQWMAFMLASSIVAPIAVSELYGLSPGETATFIQRTMFLLGVAGILQGIIGHRLPINEGPAGIWWGVFAVYASFIGTVYESATTTLQALQGTLIVSGIVFILFSVLGWMERLKKWFTPTVTFVYLMLLILQLSGSFMNGMLGITTTGKMSWTVSIGSMTIVLLTFYFAQHSIFWIRQFSILFSLVIGWLLFVWLGEAPAIPSTEQASIRLPEIFVFGPPLFDIGSIVTAIFVTLLLATNMMASIRVMEEVVPLTSKNSQRDRQAGWTAGINQMIGGFLSAIGPVPISGAAGFVSTTNVQQLRPFILGCGLLVFVSMVPFVMNVLSAIPSPVGYAVTFVIFTKMIGLAFHELKKEANQDRALFIIGVSLLAGVGVMFVPAEAFRNMPVLFPAFLNNGLIFGTVLAMLMEQTPRLKRLFHRKSYEKKEISEK